MLLPLRPNELLVKGSKKARRGVLVLRGYEEWIKFLGVLGWILPKISARGRLTLIELADLMERELTDEAKAMLMELDLYPKRQGRKRVWNWRSFLMVLRAMQVFRVLELDVKGLALRADKIVVNVIYPERLSVRDFNSGILTGASLQWSLFLEDGLARRILLALMKTKPGEDQVLVDLSNLSLNIYDRIILDELRYSVQRWNTKENTLGFTVNGIEIITSLRPLNDASTLLMLACVAGMIIPMRSITHTVSEVNKDFPARGSKYHKEYRKALGVWLNFTEALKYVTEMRVPESAPKWQQVAIEMVISRLRR
ncbi:hypothetical protein Igag_0707 [Ignisphaera aggregans DSM 17230]|uniref:Uncharacterized protein n=1 Tax=Ignisphaera aggregans (strain DSM 17230 / JCM 13409 / AQ1.S1) TaxID=583356 RepID=E0SSY7_IGNAA|nr:hypothetical protein Igag_0707 [Ignisphaera aggregans DSM 17230]